MAAAPPRVVRRTRFEEPAQEEPRETSGHQLWRDGSLGTPLLPKGRSKKSVIHEAFGTYNLVKKGEPLPFRHWQMFPHFADKAVEEEYTRERYSGLPPSLKKALKLLGMIALIFLLTREWGSELEVDAAVVLGYAIMLLSSGLIVALRFCTDQLPKNFDLCFALLFSLPVFLCLSLGGGGRVEYLLGREEDRSRNSETACVFQLSIVTAAVVHFVRVSVQAKLLMVHLAVGSYLSAALWHSSQFEPWTTLRVSLLLYVQGVISFLGARVADKDTRKQWVLTRGAVNEVKLLKDEVERLSPRTVDEGIPQSVQEEAVNRLERLSNSLVRLHDETAAQGTSSLTDVFQICNEHVCSCLSVLRQSASASTPTARRSQIYRKGVTRDLSVQLDDYIEDPASCTSTSDFPTVEDPLQAKADLFPDMSVFGNDFTMEVARQPSCFDADVEAICSMIGKDWDLDTLQLDSKSGGLALPLVGRTLLGGALSSGLLQEQQTKTFLSALDSRYKPNPYHGAPHAADVASSFWGLLGRCSRLMDNQLGSHEPDVARELNHVGCAVAALAHDAGHPAVNNVFLVSTLAPLAVTYNDNSVLESYHAAVTFGLLVRPEAWIFARSDTFLFRDFRKLVVDLILATDPSLLAADIADFRLRLTDPSYALAPMDECWTDGEENGGDVALGATDEDVRQAQKMLLKAADMGHATKAWPLHVEWSRRMSEEFLNQGDMEKRRGLPVGPLNQREGFYLSKAQSGFFTFVILPLWTEVARLDDRQHGGEGYGELRNASRDNMRRWSEEEKRRREQLGGSGSGDDFVLSKQGGR